MRYALACAVVLLATPGLAGGVMSARYDEPTTRYAHGVLGDAIEHGALVMETESGKTVRVRLPERRVFEDTSPRVVDVDGDGDGEVLVVESDMALGARIAIYDADGLVAANEYIGRTNRWLAPVGVGAADLDGDGVMEVAFVDRPHLAKTLRVYRFADGALTLVGELPGVTNHRIGERDIAGGIRSCSDLPEMIVADAGWRRVLAIRFDGTAFSQTDIGPHEGRASFAAAMTCS